MSRCLLSLAFGSFVWGVALAERPASAVDPPQQRELERRVCADLALATQGDAKAAMTIRVPLPAPDGAAIIDGALDETAWSEATSVPLPYVRGAAEGRIVGEARLLAFHRKGRLFLGLRFPSRRTPGPTLTLGGPSGVGRHVGVLSNDGRVTLGPRESAASPLRSGAARLGEETTVELELELPEREWTVRLPGGDRDARPLGDAEVRLVPADTAWRLETVDAPAGKWGYRLSVAGPRATSWLVAGERLVRRVPGQAVGWGPLECTRASSEGRTTFLFHAPTAVGLTLLRVTAAAGVALPSKDNGNTPGKRVGRVAIEESSGGAFSATLATYVPDVPRLLAQVEAAAADSDVRADPASLSQVAATKGRIAVLESQLGRDFGRRAWDEAFRSLQRLGRRIALRSPLLDFQRLVFVKRRNFGGHDGFFGYTSYVKPPPASLCVLESVRAGGPARTLLHTDRGCVRDPDVAFDGRKIVFAYAKDESDSYHLYEIGSDGSELRQLTVSPPQTGPEPPCRGPGFHDVEPCYLPNGNIAFTSTRYVRYVDCVDVEPVTTLFVMDGEGGRMRGISANHVHDWHPSVLNDGRIVYTRWEYTDRSQMWPHKLFVKNPDGSATAALYGSNSWWPVSMLHARAVPGSTRILCTLAGHHSGTDQTGEIGLVDRARGTEEAGGVVALFPTRPVEPIYRDDPRSGPDSFYTEPYPLSDRWFFVSARPLGAERFGLYLADFRGLMVLIYEDDALDCLSAMPLAARPQPPTIPARVDYRVEEATIVMADVYRGAGMAGVPRGTVKALRVLDFDVRDTPGTGGLRQEDGPSGGHSCPVSALGGSWHVKRILGTVPVHSDGSAAFRIPAERRVFFQPLDERGMAIQTMRSWVEAMPGERIACVGCHERVQDSPPPKSVTALHEEPLALRPWYGLPRAFSFAREVQPVLDRHCTSCHNAADPHGLDLRGDATNWFTLAYENLRPFVNPTGPQGLPTLSPPRCHGATASRLVALLLAGHEGVRLDPESFDRIVTWIDMNVPFYDNTAITRPSRVALGNSVTGSGRAVVADAKPLWEALGNRCASCHPGGFRIDPAVAPCQVPDLPKTIARPCVNLTHPEESRILTAPLARSAGGLQRCGKAVFSDREDPAYRAALRVIRGWHDELTSRPREDMPGSVPCEAYQQTLAKRQAWLRLEHAVREELRGETTAGVASPLRRGMPAESRPGY